jgi:hypothetical protein
VLDCPITSNTGDTEFVPSKYQDQSLDRATEIIANMIKNIANMIKNKRRKNDLDN